MKYILIFLFIMGMIVVLPAHAQYLKSDSDGMYPIWPPVCLGGFTCPETPAVNFLNKAIGDPFEKSDIVVVGKIIEVKSLPEQNITQYNVGIQYYLKNEKPYDLLNVIGDGILPKEFPGSEILVFNRPIFEKNDRVFLYLISKDGKYYLSPYSFLLDNNIPRGPPPEHAIFKYKNRYFSGEKVIITGMVQKGNLYLSVAEYHAKPEVKIRFENSTNQPFFEDMVDVKPDGTFSYVSNFSAKNAKTGSYSFRVDTGSSSTGSSFEYIAYPLKQFKSGIPTDKITCKEGLVLIQKIDYSPVCVKSESLEKLRERGWAKLLFEIQIQPDQTNSHFNSQKIQNKFPNVAQRQVVMKIEDQKLQDGALGVTIIDKITRTEPSDDVVYIEIIKQWENFKIEKSMFFNITLEGDDTPISKPFLIQQSLMESHAGPLKDQFYFSLPINVPILAKAKQGMILFNYTMPDVLPKDDKYHLKFASFSDVEVELPKNAIIIENNTREYSEFWSYDKDYALTHKADYLAIIYLGNSFDVNSVIIYDITFEIRK